MSDWVGPVSQRGVPELSVVGTEQSFSVVSMDKFANRVREVSAKTFKRIRIS